MTAPSDAAIAEAARAFCEALREWGYTRRDEHKKQMLARQQELLDLCDPTKT